MSKHRVRLHHWIEGSLETAEHWFEELESAMGFIAQSEHVGKHAKVFNESNEIVHDTIPTHSTYA
jgi:hypothetical protein